MNVKIVSYTIIEPRTLEKLCVVYTDDYIQFKAWLGQMCPGHTIFSDHPIELYGMSYNHKVYFKIGNKKNLMVLKLTWGGL